MQQPAPPAWESPQEPKANASTEVVELRIASAEDDMEERDSGGIRFRSSDLELTYDRGHQTIGLRYPGLAIPKGAVIIDAWIQFTADESQSDETQLTIQAQLAPDAQPFTNTHFDVSSRSRTTAAASWSPEPWNRGDAGDAQRTPDLAAVIQEVVDQSGWQSGNALAIIVTGTGLRTAEAYEGESHSAALLHVEYSSDVDPSVNNPPIVDAGEDQTITLPDAATLDGTVTDPEDDTFTVAWAQVDGPGSVDFDDPNAVDTTATFSEAGTYALRLTAEDDQGNTASDDVTVTVNPEPSEVEPEGAFEARIASADDDMEERDSGGVRSGSSDLELTYDSGHQTVGLRYSGVTIPQGAIITGAWIQFAADESQSDDTQLSFRAHLAADAAPFATTKFDLSSRPLTSASVGWSPEPWSRGDAGDAQRTPDLASVIQEIVNQTDWESGNALAIIITGTGLRTAESYEGASHAAALLRVEYGTADDGGGTNSPPTVDAGNDQTITLPDDTADLDGTVDDPDGDTFTTTWSDVDDTGNVTFDDPNAVDTTATFAEAGTYTLRLTATDAHGASAHDDVTVTVEQEPASEPDGFVSDLDQIAFTMTGFDGGTMLTIPSIDPSGASFYSGGNSLLIVDGEINEEDDVYSSVGANAFEVAPDGSAVRDSWDLTSSAHGGNEEPTGVVHCAFDGNVYVSNDRSSRYLYQYAFDGSSLTLLDRLALGSFNGDPEGVTCDPDTGRVYVVAGVGPEIIVVDTDGGMRVVAEIDIPSTAGDPAGVPSDAEGIVFDTSGHLFIVSPSDDTLYEYTTAGSFITKYDLSGSSPSPVNLAGIGLGPSSDDPSTQSFYVVDRRVDNNATDDPRDGGLYEFRITRSP